MTDDKTRTDATEPAGDGREVEGQVSVTDRPATDAPQTAEKADSPGDGATEGIGESDSVDSGQRESAGTTGSSSASPVHGVLRRLKRPSVLVSTLLVLLLAASTAYLGYRVSEQNRAEANRAEQVAAARKYALALTSYDFQNLQGNFGAVTEGSTDRFGQQYKQVSDSLTKLIEQYKATSRGNVVEAGVVSSDDRKAVLSLFVDQSVSNTNSPQPRVDRNRMKMTLVHSGDRWLLDDVQLV